MEVPKNLTKSKFQDIFAWSQEWSIRTCKDKFKSTISKKEKNLTKKQVLSYIKPV